MKGLDDRLHEVKVTETPKFLVDRNATNLEMNQ